MAYNFYGDIKNNNIHNNVVSWFIFKFLRYGDIVIIIVAFVVIFDSTLCLKDMNEPASFVDGTVGGKCLGPAIYDNPPYMPRETISISLFFSLKVV